MLTADGMADPLQGGKLAMLSRAWEAPDLSAWGGLGHKDQLQKYWNISLESTCAKALDPTTVADYISKLAPKGSHRAQHLPMGYWVHGYNSNTKQLWHFNGMGTIQWYWMVWVHFKCHTSNLSMMSFQDLSRPDISIATRVVCFQGTDRINEWDWDVSIICQYVQCMHIQMSGWIFWWGTNLSPDIWITLCSY